jgi:hypothetical protein
MGEHGVQVWRKTPTAETKVIAHEVKGSLCVIETKKLF